MSCTPDKLTSLRRRFRQLGSAVVAFSGGVDSSVLATIAHEELGTRMIAITSVSPSLPADDLVRAGRFCREHGIPHEEISSEVFDDPQFVINDADRCYICKNALYQQLLSIAKNRGFAGVVEGTNASDLHGHRPGMRASREQELVANPLVECGIDKEEVRAIAHMLGLGSIAEQPARACLASRIPTGMPIDPHVLLLVDRAETIIRSYGIGHVRVRHHGIMARIEVEQDDFAKIVGQRMAVVEALRGCGYRYVTLDLQGYRPARPDDIAS